MSETYWANDQEQKLGPPPWSPDDPKLRTWEMMHNHDVRQKCYPEFGCVVAEQEIERELDAYRAAVRAALALADEWEHHSPGDLDIHAALRVAARNLRRSITEQLKPAGIGVEG